MRALYRNHSSLLEIYGVYYTVVAGILPEAVGGPLSGRRITEIVQEKAFGESVLTIPAALEDVEPLYPPGAVVRYDQYSGGDPFENPGYIDYFHLILRALHEHRKLRITFWGHSGRNQMVECAPCRLEYFAKDDKFRLLTAGVRAGRTINLPRISRLELLESLLI